MTVARYVLLLLSLLPLLGCEGPLDPTARSQTGRFQATVTGTIEATLEGPAEYRPGALLDNYPYFVSLSMPGSDPDFRIVFAFGDAIRPGIYQIVDLGGLPQLQRGETLVVYEAGPVVRFRGSSGALQITSAFPLRGTFEFEAEGREERRIVVRGELNFK